MGTVVLSVDAELGWGFHDADPLPADRLANARDGWLTLLDLCEAYDVPATWAVVGHLMLEDCDGRHADHPTPDGWFAHERGPDALDRELRFADGLVTAIREADVEHEIGSHTFSHVELGAPWTTREIARAEIAESIAVARDRGLDVNSFVFPRNNVGHREALAAYGIRCYRGPRPVGTHVTDRLGAVGKLLRGTVASVPPPLVTPRVDRFGLVNLPASLHLFSFEGVARSLLELSQGDPVLDQAKRGIDEAADRDGVFHMWLHPNSITEGRDVRRMRGIFAYLDRQRTRTDLTVETMATVAGEVPADAPVESELA